MRSPIVLALSALLAATAAAQSPAPATPPAPTVTGAWEGSFDHEGSVWHLAFTLTQTDTTLTGVLYKDGEDFGPVTGVVHGSTCAFQLDRVGFEGTVEGDRMRVIMTVMNGTRYPFVMVRRSGPK